MDIIISCPLCEQDGFKVRIPLLTYIEDGEVFLGYHCHVCGYKVKADDTPYRTVDRAEEELHRIIWEEERKLAEYERKTKHGQA